MKEQNLALALKSFEEDTLFFEKKVSSIRKTHINQFVAIKQGKIIDSAITIDELRNKLRKKKLDITKTVVEFVPEKEAFMVL